MLNNLITLNVTDDFWKNKMRKLNRSIIAKGDPNPIQSLFSCVVLAVKK
jgi:hypothetical protein